MLSRKVKLLMDSHTIYPLKVGCLGFINVTYIVVDNRTRQIAIIDPAWEFPKIEVLLRTLKGNLTTVLLTHSHYDHVNLVNILLDKYDPSVYLSRREMQYYNFGCKNLNPFENRDCLMLGDTRISCMLTPGHTFGSACYLLPDSLFTGDTVFIEGCGICDTYGGDPAEMFHSIQMIKYTVDPGIKIFPGHSYGKKPGCTLNHLFKENIYFQINTKEQFIGFRMRKGQKNLFKFC
jgi:hydroxyacylglutathione hydrolase